MRKTKVILVGGFLGSGKTTLLWNIAKSYANEDKKIGLISNDQTAELVDTAVFKETKGYVEEVHGSCFCCNYNGFIKAIENLRIKNDVDVIFAEPVGSCTDLSATIIQPLKDLQKAELEIAPLSVLIDPNRLECVFNGEFGNMHESAAYILTKQLEETDYVVINKIDTLNKSDLEKLICKSKEKWPNKKVFAISGKTGENITEWIDTILNSNYKSDCGTTLLDIDYDIYAEGEAVLGWLNAKIKLSGINTDWNNYSKKFMENLIFRFNENNVSIGHVKIITKGNNDYLISNITGTDKTPSFSGEVKDCKEVEIILNARVEITPEELENVVKDVLEVEMNNSVEYEVEFLNSLKPGRPNPTHRYDKIV